MQGPVYAEFFSYTRAKPPPQQNDSCSIFRTNLWITVTEVITRGLARKPTPVLLRRLAPQQSHPPPEACLLRGIAGSCAAKSKRLLMNRRDAACTIL
jgi:hypothetical protein